jgi:hypothetical protein
MAYEVRGIEVVSGSSLVHQLTDNLDSAQNAIFNNNSGAGSFHVVGSTTIGRSTNTIADGLQLHGLMRIPSWHSTTDSAQLETLASAALDNGDYNGCLFYLRGDKGKGYTGADERALSLFARPDCLYFCRQGNWYTGLHQPAPVIVYESRFLSFMDAQVLEQFEIADGWQHTLAIADLTSFSDFGSLSNTDTLAFNYESGFPMTVSISDLSSFSNFSALSNNDTLDAAAGVDLSSFSNFADGHTTSFASTFEHGQGYFGTNTTLTPAPNWDTPDATFATTFEHGQGYFGTFTSIEPTPDWDSPTASFAEGYEDW